MGEVFDLAIGNGLHECRLAATVVAAHAVALAALQVEACVVEEDLGAIPERELTIAQILAIFVLILLRIQRVCVCVRGRERVVASERVCPCFGHAL